ncbi:MAG: hypothetical protein ACI85I_001389 [Arenicella sp.]|jgi:hypothetical protein
MQEFNFLVRFSSIHYLNDAMPERLRESWYEIILYRLRVEQVTTTKFSFFSA